MTRSARAGRGRSLAHQFAVDPAAVVRGILEQAGTPLAARTIKATLVGRGVDQLAADRGWRRVQPTLRADAHIRIEANTYQWVSRSRPLSAAEAFELMVQGRLPTARRAELVTMVRDALARRADPEEEGRRHQREIDAIRDLAELATEVEELTANEAEPDVMIHRVRARVRRSGLEPIDRAGEETRFDRTRHKPISGSISDGAPVIVVRPGYVWRGGTGDVLIGRAVVEE